MSPRFIEPMECLSTKKLPSGGKWTYEIKLDGFRAPRMSANDLREDEWLLSYEANVQGWFPSVENGDHVANDPEFGFLKPNAVRFCKP